MILMILAYFLKMYFSFDLISSDIGGIPLQVWWFVIESYGLFEMAEKNPRFFATSDMGRWPRWRTGLVLFGWKNYFLT
jgi:hypothetical protein